MMNYSNHKYATNQAYSSDRFQVFVHPTGEVDIYELTGRKHVRFLRGHDATVLRHSLAEIRAAGKNADGYLAAFFGFGEQS